MTASYHVHWCRECRREIRHLGGRAACPDPPTYAACGDHVRRAAVNDELTGFNREGHVPKEEQGNGARLPTLEAMGP